DRTPPASSRSRRPAPAALALPRRAGSAAPAHSRGYLAVEQGPLALDAPAIARQAAIAAHDPVTGNRDGQLVGGDRLRHCAHRLGRTDAPCNVRIADRPSDRDLAQRLPYPTLSRRPLHIERQLQPGPGLLDPADHLRNS